MAGRYPQHPGRVHPSTENPTPSYRLWVKKTRFHTTKTERARAEQILPEEIPKCMFLVKKESDTSWEVKRTGKTDRKTNQTDEMKPIKLVKMD